MIDFRYHLVSIIAVFLALAIGVVLGSAIFGSPLISSLHHHVDAVRTTNDNLRQQNSNLQRTIGTDRRFAEAVEPGLIDGSLDGKTVVVLDMAGTSATLLGSLQDEITAAGGTVSTTIDVTDKFALAAAPDRDQLGLILGAAPRKTSALRTRAGQVIGVRMAGAAKPSGRGGVAGDVRPEGKVTSLLSDLAKAGFVDVHATGTATSPVPAGSVFLVVAGDASQPPFNSSNLLVPLVRQLADQRVVTTVAGPTDSTWRLVDAIRGESRVSERVSTVDNAETVPGRIATALSLALPEGQTAGDFGVGGDVLPTPSASAP